LSVATHPALDLKFAPGPGAGALQDLLYAELDEFEPVAVHEHDAGDGWRVFFRTASHRDSAHGALASEFGNSLLQLTAVDVDDEDWGRRSQASLTAVRIGRIVVTPPWDIAASRESRAANRDIVIVIDPSTGFGTGHHQTTRLCLELLQRRDVSGKRVIDVGTGSGVLAIAAWKLSAAHVIAIDNDPDALQNAQDNVASNQAGDDINIINVDLATASLERADVVLANLTASVLQRHAAVLQRFVVPGGVLILSGFSGDDVEDIAEAFDATPQETLVEGEWAAMTIVN